MPTQATEPGLGPSKWHHSTFRHLFCAMLYAPRTCSREFISVSTMLMEGRKAAVGGKQVGCGSAVSCYVWAEALKYQLLFESHVGVSCCTAQCAWEAAGGGQWCSAPSKGRAHCCPPGVNENRGGLAKSGKGQALNGETNPCPAPLLRGNPSSLLPLPFKGLICPFWYFLLKLKFSLLVQ